MNFEKEICENIIIEKINLSRATCREAEEFRNFIDVDINSDNVNYIINMERCEYIDSTFLGILINTLKRIEKGNGKIKFVAVHDTIKLILAITRIAEIFDIYEDNETALKSYAK